ncbi:DUF2214 domain-containing protein [Pelagibius sp. Alg239-R121]|uniref:DUF2214 domain-containing protein n=1 Tax=Pelagibius sp. Alg239-R121 TaxID=2993448 RepID=UPI0024A6D2DC|nr:DUF2214 domain-containing protein [Pelagibius sp. Alg239-R121]
MDLWPSLLEALTAFQDMALPAALRASRWIYPIVNAGHILGLTLLFGAILPLDLRLLGFWPSLPIRPLAQVLVPVALFGLATSVSTGLLLFSVSAAKYAATPLFQVKLLLILAAIVNALVLRRAASWTLIQTEGHAVTSVRLQLAGAISILLWLAVILCGRFLAYIL